MPIERNELRRVMGHFATGVTVITTHLKEGELHGLTANAFTSVSLDPPLLLISVDKKAESYPSFRGSRVFTVNILADDQEATFAKICCQRWRQQKIRGRRISSAAPMALPIIEGSTLIY